MRTFEIVLIVVNLLSLFLGVKKPSRAVWLGVAALNLGVLAIHGLVEGFRYQMIFSYSFVVLLPAYVLIKMIGNLWNATPPKVLKVIGIGIAVVLLLFTAFLAYALPVFDLPTPTGGYNIGFTYFHFVDENRADPFLDGTTQQRELMVKVYYPAEGDNSKPFSPYFHNSTELVQLMTAANGLPDFLFDHLTLVKTYSKEDLPLSGDQPTYPVILFSHGAGTSMEVQTSESENLASHGYIVVAIDHTYVSAATVFPDRMVWSREATADFNTPEPAEIITQIMADDASFVIDELSELNEGRLESIFAGRLNLDRIGAMGHSVGGAVAYNLAINDSRVKAAINLDGIVFITPNDDTMAPFLMLANDRYHVRAIQSRTNLNLLPLDSMTAEERDMLPAFYGSIQAYEEAYNRAQQNIVGLADVLERSGTLYTIEGSDHMKFTDIGLFIGSSGLRELIGIGGQTDPARCLEITNAVSRAFFDQTLKDAPRDSFASLLNEFPELKNVDLHESSLTITAEASFN